eukprot:TRINITY_DN8623_c0_g2_i1.p2 TRINITY_DN8623_c0_g2~~TRINITY_DN8623_c0_g2_i1.p2  ORF type:complete len:327 (+),score=107.75 TRINITY_DN8623_c0_g2_i1:73-981(+)
MRAHAAVLLAAGAAAQTCPAPPDVALVYLGADTPSVPLRAASDAAGNVISAEWSWMPSEEATLKPFEAEGQTLRCGHYYGWDCRRAENGTTISVDCKSDVCDVYVFLYHEPPRSLNTNGRLPLTLPNSDWLSSSCAPQFTVTTGGPGARHGAALQAPPTVAPTTAPQTAPQSTTCNMVAFRKQVDQNSAVSFSIDEVFGVMDAYWLVIAVAPGERCNSNARQSSQAACEAVPALRNALCRWVPAPQPQARAASVLQGIPTANPTGAPAGGRCEDNYCPRTTVNFPQVPIPTCAAPLSEPDHC